MPKCTLTPVNYLLLRSTACCLPQMVRDHTTYPIFHNILIESIFILSCREILKNPSYKIICGRVSLLPWIIYNSREAFSFNNSFMQKTVLQSSLHCASIVLQVIDICPIQLTCFPLLLAFGSPVFGKGAYMYQCILHTVSLQK